MARHVSLPGQMESQQLPPLEQSDDRAAYEGDCFSPDFNEVVRGIVRSKGVDISYEQAAELWDAWNLGGLMLGRTMFDDAYQTLDWLRDRGYRLGCVTNRVFGGPRFVEEMQELGLDKYFESTAVSCDVGYMKPHPKCYEYTLNEICIITRAAGVRSFEYGRRTWTARAASLCCCSSAEFRPAVAAVRAEARPLQPHRPTIRR